jgi:hypothetical protein
MVSRSTHISREYYSVDGYELRNGQRAAIGEGGKGPMIDDRDWDRVEEYVQLIGRMQETLRQVDHFLSDKLGYPEDHPTRLSIAKRLAEAAEELFLNSNEASRHD